MAKLKVLDLFSGIGGFSLGLERAGMKTVVFCEIEKFPQKVLKKHWPKVPIYDDIRKLTREQLTKDGIGSIDVVCGGFPCQPFSSAGKREGFKDDRDLWPEMFRVIQEVRPRWVIGENVAGFVNMGLDRTIFNLESEAYEVQSFVIPACAVGAPHRRDRVWIVAHREDTRVIGGERFKDDDAIKISSGRSVGGNCIGNAGREAVPNTQGERPGEAGQRVGGPEERPAGGGDESENVSDSQSEGLERNVGEKLAGPGEGGRRSDPDSAGSDWWAVEPDVGRVAHGVPRRVDRLKGLGNAVVPQIPEIIGRAIMEAEREAHQS